MTAETATEGVVTEAEATAAEPTVAEPTEDVAAVAEPTVSLIVDGATIQARPNELLIDACERNGIYIPRFCHHHRMPPVGMCRMCLVEVDSGRGPSLQPSCMVPVADNLAVETESEVTKKAQNGVLEFLLTNHPLDCPICDKGGECPLQDQTMAYGPGESRFIEGKRNFEKPIPISETIYLDRERCILCDRCTRFADEVAGDALIHFMDRGFHTQVNTFTDDPFASYFSGNTVQICPVGALTAKPYRFKARPWDLKEATSTAWTDSVGSRIVVQSSGDQVLRVLGADSEAVNWGWLSDKERFAFQALNSEARIRAPQVRKDGDLCEVGWGEAFAKVADALKGVDPKRVGLIGGARLTNEAQYAWAKLAKGVIGTDNVDAQMADGLPAEVVFGLPRATIAEACAKGGTIILCGGDPKEELGALYLRLRDAVLRNNVTLIDLSPMRSGLSNIAKHNLRPKPGALAEVAAALVDAAANADPPDDIPSQSRAIYDAAADISGPVTVILGRANLCEDEQLVVNAAAHLAQLPNVAFLPTLRRGNIFGALANGLAPGLLPGLKALEDSSERLTEAWPQVPQERGLDSTGILRAAAAGEIDVLFLLGSDPLQDHPHAALAEKGLANVDEVVAIDLLPNDSLTKHASVVLAAAGPTETSGTFTNIEGRVSVCEKVVPPVGVARPDWMIAAEIASRLGSDLGFETVEEIRAELASVSDFHTPLTEEALARSPLEGVLLTGNNSFGLPVATKVEVPAADRYSLRLVISRRAYDDGSSVAHCPAESGLKTPLELRLNPIDFDKLGVEPQTTVRLMSAAGQLELPVLVDGAVPTGVAALPWRTAGEGGKDCRTLISHGELVTEVRVERL